MGLFDKLRGSDEGEEVELKPPREPRFNRAQRKSKRRDNDVLDAAQGEEVELEDMWDQQRKRRQKNQHRGQRRQQQDARRGAEPEPNGSEDGSDEFILPGMKSVSTEEDEVGRPEKGFDGPRGEKLDRLLEQNEKIISLLEDIAGETADVEEDESDFSGSSMWS